MNKKALYFTIRNVIYSFIGAFIFTLIGMWIEPTMIDGAHWILYPFIWVIYVIGSTLGVWFSYSHAYCVFYQYYHILV